MEYLGSTSTPAPLMKDVVLKYPQKTFEKIIQGRDSRENRKYQT